MTRSDDEETPATQTPKGLVGQVIEFEQNPIDMDDVGCGLCASQRRLAVTHLSPLSKDVSEIEGHDPIPSPC